MEVRRGQDRRRSVAAAALAVVLLLTLGQLAPSSPGAARERALGSACANANAHPGEVKLKQLKRALLCLMNARRENGGKPRLRPNRRLNRAANAHNRTMLNEGCFAQNCPGERRFPGRMRDSGYPDGAVRWKASQNIGCAPTPRKMLRAFMQRSFTRGNVLNRKFRDVGVGAGKGSPPSVAGCQPGDDFVTYTVVFAWRRG